MSKRSVSQVAVVGAMLWLVALSALSSPGGAHARHGSPAVGHLSLLPVRQQLRTDLADPVRGRDIWFNNTYGGEKFFWFLQNHPDRFMHDPARQKEATARLREINAAHDALEQALEARGPGRG